jgi:hypothetical protein
MRIPVAECFYLQYSGGGGCLSLSLSFGSCPAAADDPTNLQAMLAEL